MKKHVKASGWSRIQVTGRADRQRGLTIVELTIALAIVSVVIVAAVIGVQKVMEQIRVNDQLRQSSNAAANVQKVTRTLPVLTGITTAQLVNMGVWPETVIDRAGGGAAVQNVFGRPEFINPLATGLGGAANNTQFKYSIHSVPRSSCVDLVLGLDNLSMAMSVAPNTVVSPGTGALRAVIVKQPGGRVEPVTLATQCQSRPFSDIEVVIDR